MFWRHRGLILGKSGPWSVFPNVTLPHASRSGHMYVVGKTGKGKSKFLQYCLFQDIAEGRGCGVIDPHADLVTDLLWLLHKRGIFANTNQLDRIVYLNPAEQTHVIPFNVLATPGDPYVVAQNIIEAFRRTWPESLAEAPQFTDIMLHSLLLLITTKRTLLDLPRVLTDQEFRDLLLEQATNEDLTRYFHDEYDMWKEKAVFMRQSTLNKARAILMNPHLKRMLGKSENRLDFRAIMDEGKVLLADLGHCDEESQRLIGNLLTTGIEQAAFSRHNETKQNRKPYYLYIDEFQDFSATTGSTKTLSKILSGARKFGLHLILAHQNLSQLSERMKGAVIGNVWTKVLFGVSEADAYEFAKMVGLGNVDPTNIKHEAQTETQHPVYESLPEQWNAWATTLANQKPRQAIVRDHEGGTKQIWTIPIEGTDNPEADIQAIRLQSQKQNGFATNEVQNTQQELD